MDHLRVADRPGRAAVMCA